jgi:hypothetical protein
LIDLRDASASAATLIQALDLKLHPQGGHCRETWRDAPADGSRGVGTAILYLLREGERSHWHRVDAAELWLWQAGAPLELRSGAERLPGVSGQTWRRASACNSLCRSFAGNPRRASTAGRRARSSSRRRSGCRRVSADLSNAMLRLPADRGKSMTR